MLRGPGAQETECQQPRETCPDSALQAQQGPLALAEAECTVQEEEEFMELVEAFRGDS